jgi:energy-coupling factor transporter ATP-binding protein EcfA2
MAATPRQSRARRTPGTIPQVSSALGTGDYGGRYQDRVDAWLLAQLFMHQRLDVVPGTVARVAIQRRVHGALLDDSVVETDAGIEVQLSIKVGAAFTPGNADFRDSAMLAWNIHASGRWTGMVVPPHASGFATMRHLVFLAREHDTTADFIRATTTAGAMGDRDRIAAFRSILDDAAGATITDEQFHGFLKTFVVIGLDFDVPPHHDEASAVTMLASERGITRAQAEDLFRGLTSIGVDLAIVAAGVDYVGLERRLRDRAIVAGLPPDLRAVPSTLGAYADRSFESNSDTVAGIRLNRDALVDDVIQELAAGNDVIITGPSGFGKSTLIRRAVEALEAEGPVLHLSGPRLEYAGSWVNIAAEIGLPADRRLLGDVLATHPRGITVVVDAIEHLVSPAARLMLTDLLRELGARGAPRNVVLGARSSALANLDWLEPAELRPLDQIDIEGPTEDEIADIAAASPVLGELIERSPKPFPGGLKLLSLLHDNRISQAALSNTPATESDLLDLWWKRVLVGSTPAGHDRLRIVLVAADAAISEPSGFFDLPLTASGDILAGLIRDGVFAYDEDLHRYRFGHDTIQDWAIVNWLVHRKDEVAERLLRALATPGYYRAVSLFAQRLAEREPEHYVKVRAAVDAFSDQRGANAFLSALVLSPRATTLLAAHRDELLANNGAQLAALLNIVYVEQVDIRVDLIERLRQDGASAAQATSVAVELSPPRHLVWASLIAFCLANIDGIGIAFSPFLKLAARWQETTAGPEIPYRRGILDAAISALTFLEHWRPHETGQRGPRILYAERNSVEQLARRIVAHSVDVDRDWVTGYLDDLATRGYGNDQDDMLQHLPAMSASLTDEVVAFGARVLLEPDARPGEVDLAYVGVRKLLYFPASDIQGPFYRMLRTNEVAGLALVRALAKGAIEKYARRQRGARFRTLTFELNGQAYSFVGDFRAYTWFRPASYDSDVLTSGLMAVDTWAYEAIRAGRPALEVVELLLADDAPLPFLGIVAGLIYDFPNLLLDLAALVAQPWFYRLEEYRHRFDQMPTNFDDILPIEDQLPAFKSHFNSRNLARDAAREQNRDPIQFFGALLFVFGGEAERNEFAAAAREKRLPDAALWDEEAALAFTEPDAEHLSDTRKVLERFARLTDPASYERVGDRVVLRFPTEAGEVADVVLPPGAEVANSMNLVANKMLRDYTPPDFPLIYNELGQKFEAIAAQGVAEPIRDRAQEAALHCACVTTAFISFAGGADTSAAAWSFERVFQSAREYDAVDWNKDAEDASNLDMRVAVATALGGLFGARPDDPEIRRIVFRLATRIELLEVLRGLLRGLIPTWGGRPTGPLSVISVMLESVVRADADKSFGETALAKVDADERAGHIRPWPAFAGISRAAIYRIGKIIGAGPRRITDPRAIAALVPLVDSLLDVSETGDDGPFWGPFRSALGSRAANVLAGVAEGYEAFRARVADWHRAPEVCANVIAATISMHFNEAEFEASSARFVELTSPFLAGDHAQSLAREHLTREFRDLCWVSMMVQSFEGVIVPVDSPSIDCLGDHVARWVDAVGAHPENVSALLSFLSRFSPTFGAGQIVTWLRRVTTAMSDKRRAETWREHGADIVILLLRLVTERPGEMRDTATQREAAALAEELLVHGSPGAGELRSALDVIHRP